MRSNRDDTVGSSWRLVMDTAADSRPIWQRLVAAAAIILGLLALAAGVSGVVTLRARLAPRQLALGATVVPYRGTLAVTGKGWSDAPDGATGKAVTIYILAGRTDRPTAGAVRVAIPATVQPDGTFAQAVPLDGVQPGDHSVYVVGDPAAPATRANFTIAP